MEHVKSVHNRWIKLFIIIKLYNFDSNFNTTTQQR
jgi:hypothetical protein